MKARLLPVPQRVRSRRHAAESRKNLTYRDDDSKAPYSDRCVPVRSLGFDLHPHETEALAKYLPVQGCPDPPVLQEGVVGHRNASLRGRDVPQSLEENRRAERPRQSGP